MDTKDPVVVNGRKYRELPDGKLQQVYDPVLYAKEQLSQISAGHTVQGIRLVDAANPDAAAINLHLTEDDSAKVVALVKNILTARTR